MIKTESPCAKILNLCLSFVYILLLLFFYGCEKQDGTTAANLHGDAQIRQAYQTKSSGVMVQSSGHVITILPDDRKGSRHQRFIIRLASGHTLLISHNIDIADRLMNLKKGGQVSFRGQYEWNSKGGLVHWTHRDPQYRRKGGWIEYNGKRYL